MNSVQHQLAAALLTDPSLLALVPFDTEQLTDRTVKTVVTLLRAHGPAYANPAALLGAIDEGGYSVDDAVLTAIFQRIGDTPPLDEVRRWVGVIGGEYQAERLRQRLTHALRLSPTEAAAAAVDAGEAYITNALVGEREPSAAAIVERVRSAPPKIRWRCGVEDLDELFNGTDSSGKPSKGMLAQREVVMAVAPYKVGKTREVLNWVVALLDQGASVALMVLEDDDGTYALKLAAVKFGVPRWLLERHLGGALVTNAAERATCERAIEWLTSVDTRLRVYDGQHQRDIFHFDTALDVLALDVQRFATTHVVVDYVQAWEGDYQAVSTYAQRLRAFASRKNVCVIEISQMSNETMRWGSAYGMLGAKGAGDWGQAAHVGIEIAQSPALGDLEFALRLKIAREAPRCEVYTTYDMASGKALLRYGTSRYPDGWSNDIAPVKKGRK